MKTQVEKAYDRHTKWLDITRSFGGLRETEVQDIVQEMYVLLIRNTQKGVDFSYGDDINYYYCFRILRGLYVDLMRKKLRYTFTELDVVLKRLTELMQRTEAGKRKVRLLGLSLSNLTLLDDTAAIKQISLL